MSNQPSSTRGEQGELLAHHQGLEVPATVALPSSDPEGVSAVEPHVLLLNALGNLRKASQLNGYVEISLSYLEPGDEAAVKRIDSAKAKRGKETAAAQTGFTEAVELLKVQNVTEAELRELGIHSLSAFITNYYGPHKHRANVWLAKLVKQEAQRRMKNPEATVSMVNRAHGQRPHKAEAKSDSNALDRLDGRQKLVPIHYDPRAAYIPATHREKGLAITFLDYMDNPDYDFGINDQLKEVFLHVKWENEGSDDAGMRAVESIAWEMCDYLQDAVRARQQLISLRAEALDVNPDVIVAHDELFLHPGMVDLLSYINRLEWMESGRVQGLNRDPLRTAEERWTHEGEGRHKRVHSPYTRPNRTKFFEAYITKKMKTLTFREVRAVIDDAIDNEEHRATFMARRLGDMEIYSGYSDAVQAAIDEGLSSLAEAAGLQLTANGYMGQTT